MRGSQLRVRCPGEFHARGAAEYKGSLLFSCMSMAAVQHTDLANMVAQGAAVLTCWNRRWNQGNCPSLWQVQEGFLFMLKPLNYSSMLIGFDGLVLWLDPMSWLFFDLFGVLTLHVARHPSVCRALVCTTRKVAAWISLDLFGLLFGIEVISQFGTPKVHGLSSCSPSADCQFLYMFVLYGFIWYNYGPCFETHVYPGLVPDPSVQVAACWGFLADPNGDSETNDLECRACETGSYSLRSRPLVDNIALRCFEAACFKYLFHPFSHLFPLSIWPLFEIWLRSKLRSIMGMSQLVLFDGPRRGKESRAELSGPHPKCTKPVVIHRSSKVCVAGPPSLATKETRTARPLFARHVHQAGVFFKQERVRVQAQLSMENPSFIY